jgi:hypothetical protein
LWTGFGPALLCVPATQLFMQFTLGITEELVLAQCETGLLVEPAVDSPGAARWVVCRLAELLQWPMDQLLQAPAPGQASPPN